MQARRMGFFTKEEWLKGFSDLHCDSIQKLQSKFDYLRSMLNDPNTFKAIYRYAYDFARVSLFGCFPSSINKFVFFRIKTKEAWIWKQRKQCSNFCLDEHGLCTSTLVSSLNNPSTKLLTKISGVIFLNSQRPYLSTYQITMWMEHVSFLSKYTSNCLFRISFCDQTQPSHLTYILFYRLNFLLK